MSKMVFTSAIEFCSNYRVFVKSVSNVLLGMNSFFFSGDIGLRSILMTLKYLSIKFDLLERVSEEKDILSGF